MALLPEVGRWIKQTIGDREVKCEILDHGTFEGYESNFLTNTFKATQDKYASVRYMDGTDDTLDEDTLECFGWSYCDAPAENQLEKAMYERLNIDIGNRACAACGCSSKKLQICTGCRKQYYCDATCQRAHWDTHKDACKKHKIVLKPNPRYPMAQVSDKLKARQVKIQTSHNQLLQDALNGNFTVQHTGSFFFMPSKTDSPLVHNPKAGADVQSGERYKLVINNKAFEFKWRGLESSHHSIPENQPTACGTFQYMEMTFSEEEYDRRGLHYLAGSGDKGASETFWYMLINFNTFGTVAPYKGPCHCNPNNVKGKMPLERRKLKKKWDRIFKRAKADFKDVQCMFSDTEEGCHNFKECPYKHDVEVEEEKE